SDPTCPSAARKTIIASKTRTGLDSTRSNRAGATSPVNRLPANLITATSTGPMSIMELRMARAPPSGPHPSVVSRAVAAGIGVGLDQQRFGQQGERHRHEG